MYNVIFNQKQTGDNIRYYREICGMSRGKLARLLDLTTDEVLEIENGIRKISLQMVADICTVLQVAPLEILEFVEVSE